MSVIILRLLVDFGLLVLIWIIQLIIYPGFLYYKTENLAIWHKKYMPTIGYIVAPLMISQLGLTIYQITKAVDTYHVISLLMICAIWISTFLQFVPLHNGISKGIINEKILMSLVKKNWLRTILWTLLFIVTILTYLNT